VKQVIDESRRQFLQRVTPGVVLMPMATITWRVALAADLPSFGYTEKGPEG